MNNETEELYARLQAMYEIMQQNGDAQDVENAIFEYEDCVTDEDYAAWRQKFSYLIW